MKSINTEVTSEAALTLKYALINCEAVLGVLRANSAQITKFDNDIVREFGGKANYLNAELRAGFEAVEIFVKRAKSILDKPLQEAA